MSRCRKRVFCEFVNTVTYCNVLVKNWSRASYALVFCKLHSTLRIVLDISFNSSACRYRSHHLYIVHCVRFFFARNSRSSSEVVVNVSITRVSSEKKKQFIQTENLAMTTDGDLCRQSKKISSIFVALSRRWIANKTYISVLDLETRLLLLQPKTPKTKNAFDLFSVCFISNFDICPSGCIIQGIMRWRYLSGLSHQPSQ